MPRFWGVKLTDPPQLRWQQGTEPAAEGDSIKQATVLNKRTLEVAYN